MDKLGKLAFYTIQDQTRYKSFYIILVVCSLFVLLVRGCYNADYTINGQKVDNLKLAWHFSIIVFQIICYGMFFMTTLLSMRIFTRDREDGSAVMLLSRPVNRWQYVLGRVLGTWILCVLFMFILHSIIFIITWSKTGGVIPGFLFASVISSINLLFIIITVCLLSLFMPDFAAGLLCTGIIGIGFISETGYLIIKSDVVQTISRGSVPSDFALWRVIYPKINMLQYYVGTVIKESEFQGMGPVHPVINVLIYSLLLGAVLVFAFNRREVY